jgi:hypothetical protein
LRRYGFADESFVLMEPFYQMANWTRRNWIVSDLRSPLQIGPPGSDLQWLGMMPSEALGSTLQTCAIRFTT